MFFFLYQSENTKKGVTSWGRAEHRSHKEHHRMFNNSPEMFTIQITNNLDKRKERQTIIQTSKHRGGGYAMKVRLID